MTARNLAGLAAIPLSELRPSPGNPRDRLDGIEELASSIKEMGLIQPIVVQKVPGYDGYQIVAGHRRHAAVRKLGMTDVLCLIRRDLLPDEELLTMLVENGQRAGLDAIEEARAMRRLKGMGLTNDEIARKVGRSTPFVGNRLALLSLPVEEQEQVRAGGTTIAAATAKARVDAGTTRPRAKGKKSAQHLDLNHELGIRARSRCQRLTHRAKGAASVGGVACGECWESVIRADERQHLHDQSNERGRCVLCDTTQARPVLTPTDLSDTADQEAS